MHVVYRRVNVSSSDLDIQQSVIGFDFQGVNIRANVRSSMKKGQESDPQDFLVTLGIVIDNKEGKQTPYNIDVSLLGVFKVLPSLAADRREDLVTVNGASILYGAIRETVLGLTSRFSAGPFTLPGMNFEDHAPSARKELIDRANPAGAVAPKGAQTSVKRRRKGTAT